MLCPNCAARLPGNTVLCPACGYPILEVDRTVDADFVGDAWDFAGWCILSLLSAVLIVPLAWVLAAMGRWFCRNLQLSSGETVAFAGTGPEILGWMALSLLLELPGSVISRIHDAVPAAIIWAITAFFLQALINLAILRWIIRKIVLSNGPNLHFDGGYVDYIGFHVFIGLSFLTIIGWGWALAAYWRWLAANTRGDGISIHCDAGGWDVFWRTVAAVLGCVPVVTIPLVCMWYARWVVSCITLTRDGIDA